MIILLKVLVALYAFSKISRNKGISKSFFDTVDFRVNHFLKSLKDEKVSSILWNAHNLLLKIIALLIIAIFIATITFDYISTNILYNWLSLFIFSSIFAISIPWNLRHTECVKKGILKSPFLFIPAIPLFALPSEFIVGFDLLDLFKFSPPTNIVYELAGMTDWKFAVYLSLIFLVVYILIPYFIFWLFMFPAFYIFLGSIKLTQITLDIIHKHVNENLFSVIIALIGVFVAFY